jgi:hypothetical protein
MGLWHKSTRSPGGHLEAAVPEMCRWGLRRRRDISSASVANASRGRGSPPVLPQPPPPPLGGAVPAVTAAF